MKRFLYAIFIVLLFLGGFYLFVTRKPSLNDRPSAQSHRSYSVSSTAESSKYIPKTPSSYSFSIMDDLGNTLRQFAVVHEKIMHVIIVRKDLAEFQHIHPSFNETSGIFTFTDLVFPSDGRYRIFTDFNIRGKLLPLTMLFL